MNTRPVRLAPWAAGARPTIEQVGAGSPKPGTGGPSTPSRGSGPPSRRRPPPATPRGGGRPGRRPPRRRRPRGSRSSAPTVGLAGACPARRRSRTPPAHLVLLLVRHGQTPTTGRRPAGAGQGPAPRRRRARAGRRRRRADRRLRRPGGRRVRLAAGAHPGDGGTDRQGPRPAGAGSIEGPARGRLRRLDRRRAQGLLKLPEWKAVQRPERFRFPGGESFAEMQLRITGAVERLVAGTRARSSWP